MELEAPSPTKMECLHLRTFMKNNNQVFDLAIKFVMILAVY